MSNIRLAKLITLSFLKWLLLRIVDIAMVLAGLIVVPIALIFTRKHSNELPSWAWPWDNKDPNRDGINGYYKWRDRFDGSSWTRPHYTTFIPRFMWLALRNPANRFSYKVLGKNTGPTLPTKLIEKKWFFTDLADLDLTSAPHAQPLKIGNKDRAGVRFSAIQLQDGEVIWELYLSYNYKHWEDKNLRIRLGHKIGPYYKLEPNESIQDVMTINPFSSFTGFKRDN